MQIYSTTTQKSACQSSSRNNNNRTATAATTRQQHAAAAVAAAAAAAAATGAAAEAAAKFIICVHACYRPMTCTSTSACTHRLQLHAYISEYQTRRPIDRLMLEMFLFVFHSFCLYDEP